MSRAIFKNTSVVGALTLLSRVTGLIREMAYAQFFGASALMDAFLVAFKIPNFLRRLFAEGAFSQGFVPVISEYRHKRTHEETKELVAGVAGTLGAVLFVALGVGWFAPKGAPAAILGNFGLALFLYTVGIQYGRQFFLGLMSTHGLMANLMALTGVVVAGVVSLLVVKATGLNIGYALGLFAGSGTSTPTLQASIATLGNDDPAVLLRQEVDDRGDGLAPAVSGRGPLADHRRQPHRPVCRQGDQCAVGPVCFSHHGRQNTR